MDADRLFWQDNQEMLAPAFEGDDFASGNAGEVDFCIAVCFQYLFAAEFLYLFFQYDDRWTLGHTAAYAKDEPSLDHQFPDLRLLLGGYDLQHIHALREMIERKLIHTGLQAKGF